MIESSMIPGHGGKYRSAVSATIFATERLNIGRDWKVSSGLLRILELNKISRFGMKAHYSVQFQANCKTVYTSSILVVASTSSH
jgi:hypothetical protein